MRRLFDISSPSRLVPLASALALCLATSVHAQSGNPIKIGVIAEVQSIAGAATPGGAQIAADEINAKGGVLGRKIEIVSYDNKSSSADSVRAFQRAVSEDKVSAVIASYISEVVLALEPWAARLKMPLITPGAASNEITKAIHNDYDKNKYTFHGYLTSAAQAQLVCDAAKDLLVDQLKLKTVAIMSEDAAWTKPLDVGYEACLPKAGLKVVEHVRFSPDTTDFTPIFNNIDPPKAFRRSRSLRPTWLSPRRPSRSRKRSRPSLERLRPTPAIPPMTRSTSSRKQSSVPARQIPTKWSPNLRRPTSKARSDGSSFTTGTMNSRTASSPAPGR
jgi:hypothetical protein